MIPIPDYLVMAKLQQLHEMKRISDSVYAHCLISPDEARRVVERELELLLEEMRQKFSPSKLGIFLPRPPRRGS